MKNFLLLLVCCVMILAGCAGLPQGTTERFPPQAGEQRSTTTPAAANATSVSTPEPALSATALTPVPDVTSTPEGPLILRVWAPPQFDPASDTPAGRLLQNRLDEFIQRRPDVQIEVRVKGLDGAGGLFESLSATTAAAQSAMPDLVALPHPLVQAAAIKGLLRPMNGLTNTLDDPDWYDYARQSASLQNSIFGLPFAGDALVQIFHDSAELEPATDWQKFLATQGPFGFPAADPQALFTLALYQAAGGQVSDEQGSPVLNTEPLIRTLEFFRSAEEAGVLPDWLTQYQTDQQVWEAFRENRLGALATWLTSYYREDMENVDLAQLPTPAGEPFTLAGSWLWALTSPDPNRRELAVQLAEFLTESEFLGNWSEAAGVLPTRSSALEAWENTHDTERLAPIAASARLSPATEALNSLGSALEEAVVQLLKRQAEPAAAAQGAANRLSQP